MKKASLEKAVLFLVRSEDLYRCGFATTLLTKKRHLQLVKCKVWWYNVRCNIIIG